MPRVSDMFATYLRKEDVEPFGVDGRNLTIKKVVKDSILSEGDEVEKWFMYFEEVSNPLVLNKTNAEEVENFLHIDDTDDWPGMKVNIFIDPNVQYKGKKIGGIRLRETK